MLSSLQLSEELMKVLFITVIALVAKRRVFSVSFACVSCWLERCTRSEQWRKFLPNNPKQSALHKNRNKSFWLQLYYILFNFVILFRCLDKKCVQVEQSCCLLEQMQLLDLDNAEITFSRANSSLLMEMPSCNVSLSAFVLLTFSEPVS